MKMSVTFPSAYHVSGTIVNTSYASLAAFQMRKLRHKEALITQSAAQELKPDGLSQSSWSMSITALLLRAGDRALQVPFRHPSEPGRKDSRVYCVCF